MKLKIQKNPTILKNQKSIENPKNPDHIMKRLLPAAAKLFHFYYDGFTSMSSWGKRVWIIIIIKLFIIFLILKVFFFPDFLKKEYDTDKQRGEYILDQLTKSSESHD